MRTRNQAEADDVCALLRNADIKCGTRLEEDPDLVGPATRSGVPTELRLAIYVDASDMERAVEIVARNHQA